MVEEEEEEKLQETFIAVVTLSNFMLSFSFKKTNQELGI